MSAAAVQRLNTFASDNLLKTEAAALDCRGASYDIDWKARGPSAGAGVPA